MFTDITYRELIALATAYDKYIQDANEQDSYREGFYPVSLAEFYDNEVLLQEEN